MPGMKVYITEEKELIMEPVIKWAANPNITLAVKAFGLKATVQVIIPNITNTRSNREGEMLKSRFSRSKLSVISLLTFEIVFR